MCVYIYIRTYLLYSSKKRNNKKDRAAGTNILVLYNVYNIVLARGV